MSARQHRHHTSTHVVACFSCVRWTWPSALGLGSTGNISGQPKVTKITMDALVCRGSPGLGLGTPSWGERLLLGSHIFLGGRDGQAVGIGWQGGEARPTFSQRLHLPSIMDQSGVSSNLAIWRILQSGGRATATNLIMLPIWCSLALAPIWPTWQRAQPDNLAAEPIWRNTTKCIEIQRPLPGSHDIDKTRNGNGIRLGRCASDWAAPDWCQIDPHRNTLSDWPPNLSDWPSTTQTFRSL